MKYTIFYIVDDPKQFFDLNIINKKANINPKKNKNNKIVV